MKTFTHKKYFCYNINNMLKKFHFLILIINCIPNYQSKDVKPRSMIVNFFLYTSSISITVYLGNQILTTYKEQKQEQTNNSQFISKKPEVTSSNIININIKPMNPPITTKLEMDNEKFVNIIQNNQDLWNFLKEILAEFEKQLVTDISSKVHIDDGVPGSLLAIGAHPKTIKGNNELFFLIQTPYSENVEYYTLRNIFDSNENLYNNYCKISGNQKTYDDFFKNHTDTCSTFIKKKLEAPITTSYDEKFFLRLLDMYMTEKKISYQQQKIKFETNQKNIRDNLKKHIKMLEESFKDIKNGIMDCYNEDINLSSPGSTSPISLIDYQNLLIGLKQKYSDKNTIYNNFLKEVELLKRILSIRPVTVNLDRTIYDACAKYIKDYEKNEPIQNMTIPAETK